jgi:hypothetical protein
VAQALKAYFVKQGKDIQQPEIFDAFIREVQTAVDNNGIKKMIAVSHIRKASERDTMLTSVLSGATLDDAQIKQARTQSKSASQSKVVRMDGKPMLTFAAGIPPELRDRITALVEGYEGEQK